MKGCCSLLLIGVFLFPALDASAQKRDKESIQFNRQLAEWSEVYLVVPGIKNTDIPALTKIISIDKVRNDSLFAYVNQAMMEKFLKLNIPYHVLRHPQLKDPAMFKGIKDNYPLTWNYYPTYSAYESLMAGFQAAYPDLCKIDTLTVLPSGRRLLLAKISDNVNADEDEPEFLYTSSIHGNELTGYVLMLRLIDYLLTQYSSDTNVASLVNNTEIWICPLANPDGTFHGGNNSVSGAIRFNSNGVDLNRNYPDPQDGPHPDGYTWQPETVAFMDFAGNHDFTMGANFHGGTEVFNYPWDTWPQLAADNTWWIHAGRAYADTIHNYSPSTYFSFLNNGITNGYEWYEVNGGRQDYMNYYHYCREVTIELTNSFIPPAANLPTYWDYNYRSLLNYIKESQYGVRGIVTDSLSGVPIRARVFINGHDIDSSQVYSSLPIGDYHRYLAPGTYNLTFSAPGYHSKTINGVGVSYFATNTQPVQLNPLRHSISGYLTYDTNTSLPLPGVTLYLKDSAGDVLANTITDTSGKYEFLNLLAGTYIIEVSCQLPEGGFNAVDALLIMKHFVHMDNLSGLRKTAADVNNINGINSVDAMLVQQRFVGLITAFPAPPWVFSDNSVTLSNTNIIYNIQGLCTGDVNASFTP